MCPVGRRPRGYMALRLGGEIISPQVDLLPLPPDLEYAIENGWMEFQWKVIQKCFARIYLCLFEITFLIFQWFSLCSFLHD